MKKIIEVKNLYKLYKLGDSAVRALNGVSLEIYEGEFCAIVGTSGSGKSTMLNMLAGLIQERKSRIYLSVFSAFRQYECAGKCGASFEFPRCAESPTPEKSG